jgi:hypothetical protein
MLFPFPALCLKNILDQARVYRIQPGERFIDHDQIRFMDKGGDYLCFLLHSFGELLDSFVTMVVQIQPLQPGVDSGTSAFFPYPF